MDEIIIKTAEQIEGIRKSSQLAGNTLKFISDYVKEGVNTLYLDNLIEEYMRDNGAIPATLGYHGYPKSSCISLNEVICHGIPDAKTILKNGDILNIDVTTILDGYFGDTSTMFTIGDVSDQAAKLVEDTEHALYLGIEQVKPDNYFGNIGFAIGRFAKAKKYGVVYEFCGHGVGIEFHEEPQVEHISHRNSGDIMKPGMIFTIEPMINLGKARAVIDKKDGWTARTIDKKISAQFEHTILVTKDGYEILSDVGEYDIFR
ncbi:type I methionyl aminopeptidase [Ancylomarina sp. 16SWW S1-10-2]|uniref:type I methionyl aminopeptidase n=1 Tax=Ancylomarina sp. 16SWW S1-10-2 TaxID=2499681 RepID=UPI0012AD3F87|nr:type I methionyl aminopeptidase [Ancylomarina sp. 16SWW S1-10-2]MRT94118.1 type I methionyl aminopeptidase [Ancylomarina sp. 16SWW S1-10-2]